MNHSGCIHLGFIADLEFNKICNQSNISGFFENEKLSLFIRIGQNRLDLRIEAP